MYRCTLLFVAEELKHFIGEISLTRRCRRLKGFAIVIKSVL